MKSMASAFKNCTSLVSIHLNFRTNYEDMNSSFMGCTSLKNNFVILFLHILNI